MRLLLSICLISFFYSLPSFCQVDWFTKFGGSGDDYGHAMISTPDGGYIVVGNTHSTDDDLSENYGEQDAWVVKFDEFGQKTWSRAYGSPEIDEAVAIIPLDDSYLIAANINASSGLVSTCFGNQDAWLFKIDLEGNLLWEHNYGGTGFDAFSAMEMDEEGNFIIAGYSESDDFHLPNNNGGYDAWILKVDEEGNLLWSRTYGADTYEVVWDLIKTQNNRYLIVGNKNPYSPGGTNNIGKDWWIMQIDDNGIMWWEETYGGTSQDEAHSAIEMDNGDFIVVGHSFSINDEVDDYGNIWFIRINDEGDIIWENNYGGFFPESAYAIAKNIEGNYFIGGTTLLNIEEDGTILWDSQFNASSFIIQDILPETNIYLGNKGIDDDTYLVKIDGNCVHGSQYLQLDANNVNARLYNGGGLFWNGFNSGYQYPNDNSENPKHVLFTGALWMGGIDDGGHLKVAGQTYRKSGNDFFAGPILSDESKYICNEFNRLWEIEKETVEDFLETYQSYDGYINTDEVPEPLLQYPALNNPYFSDFDLPSNHALAPFVDTNEDGDYNPLDGDYPAIKGDQNIWWIYNDRTTHQESGSTQALDMEISVMAYSKATDDYQNDATFYDYTLTYKGTEPLNDFYIGLFINPDLGDYSDDHIGCSPSQNLGYVYNGDSNDGWGGYEDEIPMVGVKFLETLKNDNGEAIGLSAFMPKDYTFTGTSPMSYYNLMQGLWEDGTPLTYGGNGRDGTDPHPYIYPDHPHDFNGWSELTVGNTPGDRGFVMSMGPIDLQPNEVREFSIAIVIQADVGGGAELDADAFFDMIDLLETDYENGVFEPISFEEEDATETSINRANDDKVKVYPNPVSRDGKLFFEGLTNGKYLLMIYTVEGKMMKSIDLNGTNVVDLSGLGLTLGWYGLELVGESGVRRFQVVIE